MAKKFLQYSMEESKCITEKTAKKKWQRWRLAMCSLLALAVSMWRIRLGSREFLWWNEKEAFDL
jgi:type II secretory pathway component PulL